MKNKKIDLETTLEDLIHYSWLKKPYSKKIKKKFLKNPKLYLKDKVWGLYFAIQFTKPIRRRVFDESFARKILSVKPL